MTKKLPVHVRFQINVFHIILKNHVNNPSIKNKFFTIEAKEILIIKQKPFALCSIKCLKFLGLPVQQCTRRKFVLIAYSRGRVLMGMFYLCASFLEFQNLFCTNFNKRYGWTNQFVWSMLQNVHTLICSQGLIILALTSQLVTGNKSIKKFSIYRFISLS